MDENIIVPEEEQHIIFTEMSQELTLENQYSQTEYYESFLLLFSLLLGLIVGYVFIRGVFDSWK